MIAFSNKSTYTDQHINPSVQHSIFFLTTGVRSCTLIQVNKPFHWLGWCKSAQKSKVAVTDTLECTFVTVLLNLKKQNKATKKQKNSKSAQRTRTSRSQEDQRDVAYKHHYILSGRGPGPATVVLRAINANVSICVQNTAQKYWAITTTFCTDVSTATHCSVSSEHSGELNLFHLLNLSDLCKAATKAKLSINTIYSKAFCGVILSTMIYFCLIVILK